MKVSVERKITLNSWLILSAILLMCIAVRLFGINWDQGQYLHPDERFLAMVVNDSKMPGSFLEYLDPTKSPLNPYNTKYQFFVYGTLPTTLCKSSSWALGLEAWHQISSVGRGLSALFDTGTALLIFFIAYYFERLGKLPETIKLIAPAIYASCVIPVQQAHFFTVDSFAVFFSMLGLLAALEYSRSLKTYWGVTLGLASGLGIACKISFIYILPLYFVLVLVPSEPLYGYIRTLKEEWRLRALQLTLIAVCSYIALRVADPHFFENANWLNPELSKLFLKNIAELRSMSAYSEHPFPPGVQWLSKTRLVFPLYNILIYGLGPILSVFVILGAINWFRIPGVATLVIQGWAILFLLYQGSQFAHTMRYFYVLYPIFAIFAALACNNFINYFHKTRLLSSALLSCALLVWPMAFLSIYTHDHSRVQASRWIYKNIPEGSTISGEHWDDGLPLGVDSNSAQQYKLEQLEVFTPDTPDKWQKIEQTLAKTGYIIFSSNRGYGSIMPISKTFPRMAEWYQKLFAGDLNYLKVAEFSSNPGLKIGSWSLEIDTQQAEEAFSVYDHPKVTIFQKKKT